MGTIEIHVLSSLVEKRLADLQAKARNTTPVFAAIGRAMVSRIRLCFRGAVSPHGVPWKPVSSRLGQTLVDTGRLRRSITFRASPKDVVVGTNVKYAPIHQFGGTIVPKNKPYLVFKTSSGWVRTKKVKIPARPFMPLDSAGNISLPGPWAASALRDMAKHLGLL